MERLPPHLLVLGEEWKARSRELADWAWERLVNRKDVWGQYTALSKREKLDGTKGYKALTLPQKKMRGKDMVTHDKLMRHFGSLRRHHLIGLHAASAEETSRWCAIDLDLHDPEAAEAEDEARRNFAAALGWWEVLQQRGYDAVLSDSNGAGGYHLWVFFGEPAPLADVHSFVQDVVSDWEVRNLDRVPETFPKSAALGGDKLGAWLRAPGLHHTRDHFTRIWSGDDWLDEPWLEGAAAIDVLLAARPGPPPPAVDGAKEEPVPVTPPRRKPRTRGKRNVCVDLDGVLAAYDRWRGPDHFGDPLPGAVAFTKELARSFRVVIFTSRLSFNHDREEVLPLVQAWLDKHGFAYDELYSERGKPPAVAYIDDRGVACRPQDDGEAAFAQTLDAVKRLA